MPKYPRKVRHRTTGDPDLVQDRHRRERLEREGDDLDLDDRTRRVLGEQAHLVADERSLAAGRISSISSGESPESRSLMENQILEDSGFLITFATTIRVRSGLLNKSSMGGPRRVAAIADCMGVRIIIPLNSHTKLRIHDLSLINPV